MQIILSGLLVMLVLPTIEKNEKEEISKKIKPCLTFFKCSTIGKTRSGSIN